MSENDAALLFLSAVCGIGAVAVASMVIDLLRRARRAFGEALNGIAESMR